MHSISNAISSKEELMTPIIMPVVNSKTGLLNRDNSSDNLKGNRANRHVLDTIENSNSIDILENIDINLENGISIKRRRVTHDYRILSSSGRIQDNEHTTAPSLVNTTSLLIPNNQLLLSEELFVDVSMYLLIGYYFHTLEIYFYCILYSKMIK